MAWRKGVTHWKTKSNAPSSAPKRKRKSKGKASVNKKVDVRIQIKQKVSAVTASGTIAGGSVGTYMYSCFGAINPDYPNVQGQAEHKLYMNLYDEFCIKKVSVKFTPTANAQQIIPNGLPLSTLYSWVDQDGRTPVSSAVDVPTKLQVYDSCKRTALYKSVTRQFTPKTHWLDCNRNYTNSGESTRADGLLAMIGFYAQQINYSSGASIGDFNITWTIAYRGKKPSAFGINQDGSILVSDMEQYPMLPTTTPSIDSISELTLEEANNL